jgi:hypothetical protein
MEYRTVSKTETEGLLQLGWVPDLGSRRKPRRDLL